MECGQYFILNLKLKIKLTRQLWLILGAGVMVIIVIALGTTPNHDLTDSLKGRVPEIYVVGDALKAGEVMEALSAAEEVALKI